MRAFLEHGTATHMFKFCKVSRWLSKKNSISCKALRSFKGGKQKADQRRLGDVLVSASRFRTENIQRKTQQYSQICLSKDQLNQRGPTLQRSRKHTRIHLKWVLCSSSWAYLNNNTITITATRTRTRGNNKHTILNKNIWFQDCPLFKTKHISHNPPICQVAWSLWSAKLREGTHCWDAFMAPQSEVLKGQVGQVGL